MTNPPSDPLKLHDASEGNVLGLRPYGRRIEIPVHFDLWMQGARFGTVVHITKDGAWVLRMDNRRVRKQVVIMPEDQAYCKVL